jgi:hypothetical protein
MISLDSHRLDLKSNKSILDVIEPAVQRFTVQELE